MKKLLLLLLLAIAPLAIAESAPPAQPTALKAQASPVRNAPADPKLPAALGVPAGSLGGVCPTGCVVMSCPPPGGPTACCKKVNGIYQVCPPQ